MLIGRWPLALGRRHRRLPLPLALPLLLPLSLPLALPLPRLVLLPLSLTLLRVPGGSLVSVLTLLVGLVRRRVGRCLLIVSTHSCDFRIPRWPPLSRCYVWLYFPLFTYIWMPHLSLLLRKLTVLSPGILAGEE